jgi:Tol biopolymer transport system component
MYLSTLLTRFILLLLTISGLLLTFTLGIANAASFNAEIAFAYEGDIYLLNLGNNQVQNLTEGSPAIDKDPAWSPDGQQLVFAAARGSDQQIYLMSMDGTESRVLTSGEASKFRPQWSPDGTWIAYAAYGNRYPQLYALNLSDNQTYNLSKDTETAFVFDWSPDGRIAFAGANGVNMYIAQPDGSDLIRAKAGENIAQVYYFSPRWSPDGQQIAFTARVSDRLYIRIGEADGQRQRTLAPGNVPVWSPDSRMLAYIDHLPQTGSALFAANAQTGSRRQLSRAYEFAFSPAWSPDGRIIAFGCTMSKRDLLDGAGYLCFKDVGTGVVLMTSYRIYHLSSPVWRP